MVGAHMSKIISSFEVTYKKLAQTRAIKLSLG